MRLPLQNGEHGSCAAERAVWRPAEDHATSSRARSSLISTSGWASLNVIPCDISFTLNRASHVSSSAELSRGILIGVVPTRTCTRHSQNQHSVKKYGFMGGRKGKLSAASSCQSWAPRGEMEKLVLAMKARPPPPPPQKPSLPLLEQPPGCIHEGNNFLQVLRQEWRAVFCPKTFCTLWRSPLSRRMATLPSQVCPKSPVADALL